MIRLFIFKSFSMWRAFCRNSPETPDFRLSTEVTELKGLPAQTDFFFFSTAGKKEGHLGQVSLEIT